MSTIFVNKITSTECHGYSENKSHSLAGYGMNIQLNFLAERILLIVEYDDLLNMMI